MATTNDMILPAHADHPGWAASNCALRIVVTRCAQNGASGFACSYTGGHCLPGTRCAEWVEKSADWIAETNNG